LHSSVIKRQCTHATGYFTELSSNFAKNCYITGATKPTSQAIMPRSRTPTKESKGKAPGGKFVTDEILEARAERKARAAARDPWDGQPPENTERWRRDFERARGDEES
jgi:hypothetical protein